MVSRVSHSLGVLHCAAKAWIHFFFLNSLKKTSSFCVTLRNTDYVHGIPKVGHCLIKSSMHRFNFSRRIFGVVSDSLIHRAGRSLTSACLWLTRPNLLRILPRQWGKIQGKKCTMQNFDMALCTLWCLHVCAESTSISTMPTYWALAHQARRLNQSHKSRRHFLEKGEHAKSCFAALHAEWKWWQGSILQARTCYETALISPGTEQPNVICHWT